MSDSGARSLSPRSTSQSISIENVDDLPLTSSGGTIARVLNFFKKRSHAEANQDDDKHSQTRTKVSQKTSSFPQNDRRDYKNWKMMLNLANEPLNNSFEATKKRRMLAIQALKTAANHNSSIPRSASIVESNNEGGLFSSLSGSLVGNSVRNSVALGSTLGRGAGVGASGMPGGYLTLFSARQTQMDLLNDLEQRRRSIIDRDVHYYVESPEQVTSSERAVAPEVAQGADVDEEGYGELLEAENPPSRFISPMDGVLVHPQSHIRSQFDLAKGPNVGNYYSNDNDNDEDGIESEMEHEGEGNLPLIIEHEFAPLYRDVNGNLVRPPFINLDPRERYQLLQLKKSVEASESLQNRIKYMADPLETHSRRLPQTNKVETSTQTHDFNSLSNQLNFVRKRRIERDGTSLTEPRTKKPKNSKGYFVCDFDYDVAEEVPEKKKASDNMKGYLGEVSTPKIQEKVPDQAEVKSTAQRYGLDDLFAGKKQSGENVKLDAEYLAKNKSREEKPKLESGKALTSLFGKTPAPVLNAPTAPKSLFGGSNVTPAPPSLPSFNFGKKSNDEEEPKRKRVIREVDEEPPTPKSDSKTTFSFSSGKQGLPQSDSKSAFSVGEKKDATPPFSFGEKKGSAPESGAKNSLFSFGSTPSEQKKKDESAKINFSFGTTPTEKKKQDDVSKLNFSFGATPSTTSEKKEDASVQKPAFSFGAPTAGANLEKKAETPKSLFPTTTISGPTENKESGGPPTSGPTPAFSLGVAEQKKKEDSVQPAFSFGLTKKPEVNATSETKVEKSDVKPAFSFGSTSAPQTSSSSAPPFTFGGENKNASSQQPSFNFGEKKKEETTNKPAFSFGAESSTPGSTDKREAKAPVFNFGGASTKPASPFTFGAELGTSVNSTSKPALTFGTAPQLLLTLTSNILGTASNSNPSSQSPAPISFGNAAPKVETPKPVSSAFSFGNNISNGSSAFDGTAFNGSTPQSEKAKTGLFSQPLQQGSSQILQPFSFGQANPAAPPQQFSFGGGGAIGTAVSNPNSREVSPAFNFQKSGASSSPNLNMGFQHQTPIQPLLIPNINFGGGAAPSDPSVIFSSTTPPPTTGTPPLGRSGRRIALPRSRRR